MITPQTLGWENHPAKSDTTWRPHPNNSPQQAAYASPAFELLYGGAAGGGKSDLLLGLARTQHCSALLLRRTYTDLERSLIERSLQFYGSRDAYNASKHYWRIEGRRIEFGHMEHVGTPMSPGDEANYAGAPYDLIGFDQLEQFPQYAYEFMLSRARTTRRGQRVRIVSSANPVGEGVEWIIQRWGAWLDDKHPHPAQPGEIRYYKRDAAGREVETLADDPNAMSRTFIPAGLKDNPYLGDDYRRTLNLLPEPLRSALLNGNWQALIVDDAYQVVPRAWVKAAQARWKPDGRPTYRDEAGVVRQVPLSAMGIDVARGGDDKSVCAERYRNWIGELVKYPGTATKTGPQIIAKVIRRLEEIGEASAIGQTIHYRDDDLTVDQVKSGVPVLIDVIGVGASVYDTARTHGLNARAINWAEGSKRRDRSGKLGFINKRAEHWWTFREWLDPGNHVRADGTALPDEDKPVLPPDPELLADLCAPRWVMQSNGIKIESKEEIKKRLNRSPDCGDAVVIVNADESNLQLWL